MREFKYSIIALFILFSAGIMSAENTNIVWTRTYNEAANGVDDRSQVHRPGPEKNSIPIRYHFRRMR